jgi:DNA-binding GntR family transcriptional regulator
MLDNENVHFQGKSDAITSALRELIITGGVEPGAPLRQRDLAARFKVSPTPIREALRRLEAEGLVNHNLHRGVTVIDASFDVDEEGYHIRAALESLAARLAADRISDQDLESIQELHEQFASCPPKDPRLRELNRRFHFRIYEASRSPVLLALLRLLWQSFHQGPLVIGPQSESVKHHEQILEALRARDAETAERVTRQHILEALDFFLKSDAHKTKGRKPAQAKQATRERPSA